MIEERYGLAVERIREMKKEQTAKEPFTDYFHKMAEFVLMIDEVRDKLAQGTYWDRSREELAEVKGISDKVATNIYQFYHTVID